MKSENNLEQSLDEIEIIIEKMDKENLSLEESFELYNKGIQLCKKCNEKIDKVEKQLEIISGGNKDGL